MRLGEEPKTQTIDEAAKELGIGRNQAYAAARRGEIPTIRIENASSYYENPLGDCWTAHPARPSKWSGASSWKYRPFSQTKAS
jgi:hypothetical protein